VRRKNSAAAGPPCSAARRSYSARNTAGAASVASEAPIGGSINTAPAHAGVPRRITSSAITAPKLDPTIIAGADPSNSIASSACCSTVPVLRRVYEVSVNLSTSPDRGASWIDHVV
jgi:hypothetical protein